MSYTPFYQTMPLGVKRSPQMQVELAVRILQNRHAQDVLGKARDILGSRANVVGPVDLTRNPLRSYCDRIGRAYSGRPPLVSSLVTEMAASMGDASASTTIDRYGEAGGYPMPTPMVAAGEESLRYRLGVGYAGTLLGWSERSERAYLDVITPDMLECDFASDDPTEPTVIRHRGTREVGDKVREVIEVYDLTDLEAPSYRILLGDEDVTAAAIGQSYSGDAYPWRYEDGTPFHRVVITGRPRDIYERAQLVEGSLIVPVRWTAWGSGTDHASHPQRNVRGLRLAGADSDMESGEVGAATGPETVMRWVDDEPERPGDHWQDAPAYDPETLARAIRTYELAMTSAMDLPLSWEGTGGEPSQREQEALDERIRATFAECRRADGEILRRVAAMLNRQTGSSYPESGYGVLYRDEVAEALEREPATTTTTDEGRNVGTGDGRGGARDEAAGRAPEGDDEVDADG